jgi:hypothetical protein
MRVRSREEVSGEGMNGVNLYRKNCPLQKLKQSFEISLLKTVNI